MTKPENGTRDVAHRSHDWRGGRCADCGAAAQLHNEFGPCPGASRPAMTEEEKLEHTLKVAAVGARVESAKIDRRTPEAKKWPDEYIPPRTCPAIDDAQNSLELLRDTNSQLRHAAEHWRRKVSEKSLNASLHVRLWALYDAAKALSNSRDPTVQQWADFHRAVGDVPEIGRPR